MEKQEPNTMQRFIKTFQLNNQQTAFGSYAAELSFYVIWSIAPIMLALANVIAVLPIDQGEIISFLQIALPDEVEVTIIPLLENYLATSNTGVLSVGLIISLWPASNIFNTLQRLFNTIYKAEPRQNPLLSRLFAYVFMVALVILGVAAAFVLVFGEAILNFVQESFGINLGFLDFLVSVGPIIGVVAIFIILLIMYYLIPNVNWSIKYAIPGAIFAILGFVLVSQLFNLYLAFAGNSASNTTLGVFVVLIIWLYFNGMVLAIGAYVNVFYHDFKEKSYWSLVEETRQVQSFRSYSDDYRPSASTMPQLQYQITKVTTHDKNHANEKGEE